MEHLQMHFHREVVLSEKECVDCKTYFSQSCSSFMHEKKVWLSVNSHPHCSHNGLCCFVSKKCVRCICPIRRRHMIISMKRSWCLHNCHSEMIGLTGWSLLLVSFSHVACHFALSLFRNKFTESLADALKSHARGLYAVLILCFSRSAVCCASCCLDMEFITKWCNNAQVQTTLFIEDS